MAVPLSLYRHRSEPSDGVGSAAAPSRATRVRRCERSTRPVLGAGPGYLLLAGTAPGTLAQIEWGERGLELSPGAAIAIGIVLFAAVGAAVVTLTNRDGRSDQSAAGTADETPPLLTGDTSEDTQAVLVRDGSDWTWRVLHREALAESPASSPTRSTATERIERTRDAIDDAGFREVTDAVVRLYRDADETWRWSLVRADGDRVATAPEGHDTRDDAEAAVSLLKDCGPEADVLDLEEAAITIDERRDRWRWELVDDERTPLAASANGYDRRADAEAAAETFVERIGDARVLDVDEFGVELYELESETGSDSEAESQSTAESDPMADDGWGWRLVDSDGEVVADATASVETRPAAEDAATTALAALEDAAVTEAGEPTYERYPDSDGETWRWRLVDETGRVIARAPTELSTADEAERATDLFRETAPDADLLEIDGAAYEVYPATEHEEHASVAAGSEANVRGDPGDTEPPAVADGAGLEATDADWRWRLVAADREVIAESAIPYADAETTRTALERLREEAREADVVGFETAAFRVYEDDGDWRWRLLEAGGTVLADSDGDHDSRNEAIEAMLTLQERAPDADVVEIDAAAFELYVTGDDTWSWRLIDGAGRRVAEAPDTYPTRDGARAAADRFRNQLAADVYTLNRATFQPYAAGDEWRWRFVRPTGETLAVSGSPAATRDELRDRLADVRETAATSRAYTTGAVTVRLAGDETWQWELLDRDREPILESTAVYPSREAARSAVEDLERASDVPVFSIGRGEAAIWLERASDGWRWDLVDRDREALATADGTAAKSEVAATIDDVQRLAPLAEQVDVAEASFDIVEDDGGWRWRLLDDEGQPVAIGDDTVETKAAARAAIDDAQSLIAAASVVELEGAAFERYRDGDDGEWRWRLVDEHGNTLLESARSYETRTATQEALSALQAHASDGEPTVVA